jgi:hypothetical protein
MGQFQLLTFPTLVLSTIHLKLAIHFFLEDMIVNNYLYLSKLAAQMVISTSSKNLFYLLYEFLNKNFDFFQWGSANKIMALKNFFPEQTVEVRSFDLIVFHMIRCPLNQKSSFIIHISSYLLCFSLSMQLLYDGVIHSLLLLSHRSSSLFKGKNNLI